MTDMPEWLDASRPNVARVYDYWLGGKDNFAADRELAESMLAIFPGLRELVRANRQFITRAVSWVAGQGIDQFIDAGAGLPTRPATHESAQAVNPPARVAYVDNDPVVINHAEALLAGQHDQVSVVRADLRDPDAVLKGCTDIDTSRPLCLILAAVLHLMDADSARRVAAGYTSRLPHGSYVIITLARYDDPVLGEQIMRAYSAASFFNHSREDAASFFTGLELIEPGLASGTTWRGGMPDPGLPNGAVYPLAGVARKPLPAAEPRHAAHGGQPADGHQDPPRKRHQADMTATTQSAGTRDPLRHEPVPADYVRLPTAEFRSGQARRSACSVAAGGTRILSHIIHFADL
jgi:O-methyltransferase involved in polyketide biosynthesis